MESISSVISQLLLSEAIKEFEKYYHKMNNKDLHIESKIFEMGLKPGFSLAAQICMNGSDIKSFDEAGKFISTKLAQTIFDCRGRYKVENNNLIILFKSPFPNIFKCLLSNDDNFSYQQKFWFKCYSSFFSGVFSGALSHFGYKSIASFDPINNNELIFKFELTDYDGSWEFASKLHH